MIQGQPCTRIERTRTYTAYFDPTILTDTLSNLYTYSASGIVWMLDPELNAFDTLYDFNALPGDSWQLIHLPEYSAGSDFLTVLDTGHISIDGQALRWLSVEYHFQGATGNDPPYLDTLMERVGSNTFYMLPYDFPNGFVDGNEGGFFRCYSDNEISYQSPFVQACDFPLEVTEHAARPTILVYPNPGSDVLHIEIGTTGKIDVHVLDATGRAMLSASGATGSLELSSAMLLPGVYLVEENSAEGRRTVKWIKQ